MAFLVSNFNICGERFWQISFNIFHKLSFSIALQQIAIICHCQLYRRLQSCKSAPSPPSDRQCQIFTLKAAIVAKLFFFKLFNFTIHLLAEFITSYLIYDCLKATVSYHHHGAVFSCKQTFLSKPLICVRVSTMCVNSSFTCHAECFQLTCLCLSD